MEKVRQQLTITAPRIIPALFDEHFLVESGYIDSAEMVDKSGYQVSNFGTYIELKDKTIIEVSLPFVGIQSENYERLTSFYKILKTSFPKLKLSGINFSSVIHISKENIFEETIGNILDSSLVEIDQIRFRKDSMKISVHECKKDRLHIKLENLFSIKPENFISELDFNPENFISQSEDFLNQFINQELKLNDISM